jgi:hypothetical protein
VRRFAAALLFLMFADDGDAMYAKYMFAPFGWVHSVLFLPIAKIRPFDVLMAIVLVAASAKRTSKTPNVAPMRSALLVGAATVVTWFVLGMARGGSLWAASWQVYLMLSSTLVAFTIAATCRTVAHFASLAKVLLAAAAYRAFMCWAFYLTEIRTLHIIPFPEYATSHDDTVLWVTALLILAAYALHTNSRKSLLGAAVFAAFLLGAVAWNARRLAWVSLSLGLLTGAALLQRGMARRRVRRIAIVAAPLIVLYVAVGTGRSERIFRPLQALSSVSTQEDASTKARNVENLGLIATAHGDWITGTGWGHKYIALSDKYSISQYFDLWPYIPHNSILGLLAFMGTVGFAGYWLAFPTAMFLNARTARFGNVPAARIAGIIGATEMVVCAAQLYGDMGIFSIKTMYVLAGSYALALRLPPLAGAWQAPKPAAAPPQAPALAGAAAWKS